MTYIVYKVIAERTITEWDCDMCPYETSETIFEMIFSSKVKAIAKAQSIFEKKADFVRVIKLSISENGTTSLGVVYKKCYN